MIDVSLCTPIQDPSVYQFPLDLVSELLQRVGNSCINVNFLQYHVSLHEETNNLSPTQNSLYSQRRKLEA